LELDTGRLFVYSPFDQKLEGFPASKPTNKSLRQLDWIDADRIGGNSMNAVRYWPSRLHGANLCSGKPATQWALGSVPWGWYMSLFLRKIPKRGYFMSLRQAGVGASLSRNLQNQSCVARLAPGRPESGKWRGVWLVYDNTVGSVPWGWYMSLGL
jgi:hypothetical protein